jgi:hypothetical protein
MVPIKSVRRSGRSLASLNRIVPEDHLLAPSARSFPIRRPRLTWKNAQQAEVTALCLKLSRPVRGIMSLPLGDGRLRPGTAAPPLMSCDSRSGTCHGVLSSGRLEFFPRDG